MYSVKGREQWLPGVGEALYKYTVVEMLMNDLMQQLVAMYTTWLLVTLRLQKGEEIPPEVFEEYSEYTREGLELALGMLVEQTELDMSTVKSEIHRAVEALSAIQEVRH